MNDLLHIEYDWNEAESNGQGLPIFNACNYIASNDTAMHCPSLEQAKMLLKYLDNHGYRWFSGMRYTETTYWEDYHEDTCYCFLDGSYCSLRYCIDKGYPVLEFDDFDWNGQENE